MKTTTVARGFIGAVASLLGVVAVGCSADSGWDEASAGNGEIGSVEQAIVEADVDNNAPAATIGAGVAFHNVCNVNSLADGSGTWYSIVIAGQTGAGTFSNNAYLIDGSTVRGPFALPTGLTSGTSKFPAITRQNDKRECVFGGGTNGSNLTQVAKATYTTSGGNPALTITQAGSLPTAVSDHSVAYCGNKSLVFMGGNAGISDMYVWNGTLNSDAGPTGTTALVTLKQNDGTTVQTLNNARTRLAVVSVDNLRFALAGGEGSGSALQSAEGFIVVDDASLGCKMASSGRFTAASMLGTGRFDLVAYHENADDATISGTPHDRDLVTFVGGDTGVAGVKTETVLRFDWTAKTIVQVSETDEVNTFGLSVAAARPAIGVKNPGSNAIAHVVGGIDASTAIKHYQENDSAPWSAVDEDKDNNALLRREGVAAIFNPSANKIFVFGGRDGSTYHNNMDQISP